eukprot:TRINITY_DN4291_c0_g1_i2.p1 TRINITY_DN4291_c0_g1~~TRINITY_DN4291_c0_g1_i2.p1  ORF type:complete len:134 (+),score=7.51 TRINITY_DN4291_c0_g1_i2:278-679(+)
MSGCHNLGFPSNANTQIVSGYSTVGKVFLRKIKLLKLFVFNFKGGIAGYFYNSTIFNSGGSNGVIVSGGIQTGGLIGYAARSSISQCYIKSTVNVISQSAVGGLIGYHNIAVLNKNISNSYTRANVKKISFNK